MKSKPAEPAKRGRPSDLTPERTRTICEALEQGLSDGLAAQLAGVAPSTLAGWKKRGADPQEVDYVEFLTAYKKAEAKFAQAHLCLIAAAATDPKNWTASAWLLERRFPDDFGRRERVEATVDARVNVVTVKLPEKKAL